MENQMKTVRPGPDVLDLDNSELVGGGGVADFYCEDAASEYLSFSPWSRNIVSGVELLRDPRYNKGTAFTDQERDTHYLPGLLPPSVVTQELQIERILKNVRAYETHLERYVEVMDLQELNERLFYMVLIDHVEELLPLPSWPLHLPQGQRACAGMFKKLARAECWSHCCYQW